MNDVNSSDFDALAMSKSSINSEIEDRNMSIIRKMNSKLHFNANFFNDFFKNIILGLLLTVIFTWFPFGIGDGISNNMYDRLIKGEVQLLLAEESSEIRKTISEQLMIVQFDDESYTNSSSEGYWTPRKELIQSISHAIRNNAKVIVVDFELDTPIPQICASSLNEQRDLSDSVAIGQGESVATTCSQTTQYYGAINENWRFLQELEETAVLARQQGTIIIFPKTNNQHESLSNSEYRVCYNSLFENYSDILKRGSVSFLKNSADGIVRRFQFYEEKEDGEIIFSVPLLAVMYQLYDTQKAEKYLADVSQQLRHVHNANLSYTLPRTTRTLTLKFPGKKIHSILRFRIIPGEIIDDFERGQDLLAKDNTLAPSLSEFLVFNQREISGKIVMIGANNKDDMHVTPIGTMSGLFLLANTLNNLLKGHLVFGRDLWQILTVGVSLLFSSIIFSLWDGKKLRGLILQFILLVIGFYPIILLCLVIFRWQGRLLEIYILFFSIGGIDFLKDVSGRLVDWAINRFFSSPKNDKEGL